MCAVLGSKRTNYRTGPREKDWEMIRFSANPDTEISAKFIGCVTLRPILGFIFNCIDRVVTWLRFISILQLQEEKNDHLRSQGWSGERRVRSFMTYTPQAIANYFLEKAFKEGRDITQMKLQKLVYIAYGWNLAVNGERLFEESIQAWDHGPVIPSLYHEFKDFGSEPISKKSMIFDLDTFDSYYPQINESDYDVSLVLKTVWESYKQFSSAALRRKTHEPDTPWSRVYDPKKRGIKLDDKDIKEHFEERIWQYLDAAKDDEAVAS